MSNVQQKGAYCIIVVGFRMDALRQVHSKIYSTVGFRLTPTEVALYVAITLVLVLLLKIKLNSLRYEKFASKISGPPAYPIIGSLLQFIGTPKGKRNQYHV